MLKKLALLAAVSVFSNVANAGLFDSNDFKCGRDDAIKALSEYIKNEASGLLQRDFLTKSKYRYDKPVAAYQSKLDSIAITVTNVSTVGDGNYGLKCSATVALPIPQETLDIVSSAPNYLYSVTGADGKINNGSVVWNDISYNAKLADNKKDIIFSNFSRTTIVDAMFNVSVLSENKDKIVKTVSQVALSTARSDYMSADRELNAVWKELPESARNALKKEQLTWVNEKVKNCGSISSASSETNSVDQRTAIYQCQAKMTDERISYLSGNNN